MYMLTYDKKRNDVLSQTQSEGQLETDLKHLEATIFLEIIWNNLLGMVHEITGICVQGDYTRVG